MAPYVWFAVGLVFAPIFGILIHVAFGHGVITTTAVIAFLVGTSWNLCRDLRKRKEKRLRLKSHDPPLEHDVKGWFRDEVLGVPKEGPEENDPGSEYEKEKEQLIRSGWAP